MYRTNVNEAQWNDTTEILSYLWKRNGATVTKLYVVSATFNGVTSVYSITNCSLTEIPQKLREQNRYL